MHPTPARLLSEKAKLQYNIERSQTNPNEEVENAPGGGLNESVNA